MGNYISCTLSTVGSKHGRGIKVIFPSGEIQNFEESTKAGELMVEMPSFVVVNTVSLKIGRRFSALNADEELEFGNVYVMVPMKKLNSVVTASDMGALLITAKRKVKIVAKMEEQSQSHQFNKLDDFEIEEPEFIRHRLSNCRSKKPLLETIAEEPLCSA